MPYERMTMPASTGFNLAVEPGQSTPVTCRGKADSTAEASMNQTKNDLPAQTRADVIEILNARLADMTKSKECAALP
jgi:hypothetical protein